MQTIYNPLTQSLSQNDDLQEGVDIEYLGPHHLFNGILGDFVKGEIVKSTRLPRESYMGQKVIDMSKIRMDFARNEVNASTLRIIDREFFDVADKAEKGPNFSDLSSKLTSGLSKMLSKPVKAADLGYQFSSSESECEAPVVQDCRPLVAKNSKLKQDLDEMSKYKADEFEALDNICEGINDIIKSAMHTPPNAFLKQ
jgi:hypothetical protein